MTQYQTATPYTFSTSAEIQVPQLFLEWNNFSPVTDVQTFLALLPPPLPEDKMYELSLQYEPRNAQKQVHLLA